ncbi:MAG: T9SS type A sorting domain-containing protein [Bacteroidetes bacterium]|nr:T9SS type A sorting domain-containing protein [Bacteroidota bacterium]
MKKIFTLLFIALCGKLFSQPIVIPTVFHVIYNSAAQNISNSQVLQQLQQLNSDYSDTTCAGTYAQDINTEIQFVLAQQDPNGNATNGIIHKQTTVASFTTNNAMMSNASGGDDIWDRDSYLNIYVCNLGGGLLGYAQFPCGAAGTDALVIHYCTAGSLTSPGTCAPYQYGRTASSELGHWFGLFHTVGNSCAVDVDGIPDTYTADGICSPLFIDTCSGLAQFLLCLNYMTFSDDGNKCFFTSGQKAVMWNSINSCRSSLKTSIGGNPPTGVQNNSAENSISIFPNPSSGIFSMQLRQFQNVQIKIYNVFGECIYQHISTSSNFQIDLSSQPAGIYYLSIHSDKYSITKQLAVVK